MTLRSRGLGVVLKLLRFELGTLFVTLLFTLLFRVVLRERGLRIEGRPCISTMLGLPRLLFADKLSPRVNRELRTEKLLSRATSHQPAE